jgi:tetratricopeptide (TPR) repeat protein
MDASDITRLLTSRHYSPADLDDVKIICRNYPEFSAAHMLKVRIMEALGREKKQQLKLAAVYSMDRKKLFQLVHDLAQPEEPETKDQDESEELIMFSDEADHYAQVIIEEHAPYAGNHTPADLLELDEDPDNSDETEEDENDVSSELLLKDLEKDETDLEEPEEKNKNHLIINFIKGDPGPIRADKETSLKGDVSLDSIKEHDGFITDTLARIYVKQGRFAKAIYAYEKLSLKYPEKSAYFAAQIEKIRNINHS